MNLTTLKAFRHDVYGCFGQAKYALFNTVDALLTEDRTRSFPELSRSPHFERRWPSLYEGFEDGTIDQKRLQQVFARFLPQSHVQDLVWVGIDVSGIARTSADRSALYVHNLPECKKPITVGWKFSTVVLPPTPSSWTYVLDQQRVSTHLTAAQVAFAQLQHLVPCCLPLRSLSWTEAITRCGCSVNVAACPSRERWCASKAIAASTGPLPQPPANEEHRARMGPNGSPKIP